MTMSPFNPMNTIPKSYGKNGYQYTLADRVDNVAIYEQRKGGKLFAFEVVKVRVRKAGERFGKTYPDMEFLPGNEEWGQWGKTYTLSLTTNSDARKAADAQMGILVSRSTAKRLKIAPCPRNPPASLTWLTRSS